MNRNENDYSQNTFLPNIICPLMLVPWLHCGCLARNILNECSYPVGPFTSKSTPGSKKAQVNNIPEGSWYGFLLSLTQDITSERGLLAAIVRLTESAARPRRKVPVDFFSLLDPEAVQENRPNSAKESR